MKTMTIDSLNKHKESAIDSLKELIDYFSEENLSKADKLCYWLEDYAKFLTYERDFDATRLKRYKRGEVIKAHLGFRVGSEEGGLHYCIVLDNDNKLSSPLVTVVPLTSVKDPDKKLGLGKIYIGDEIYKAINDKINIKYKSISAELTALEERSKDNQNIAKDELGKIRRRVSDLIHMQDEFDGMKRGSIALINQVCTISKIRIYSPKTKYDTLSGIRVSNDTLNKIDAEMNKLFLKK